MEHEKVDRISIYLVIGLLLFIAVVSIYKVWTSEPNTVGLARNICWRLCNEQNLSSGDLFLQRVRLEENNITCTCANDVQLNLTYEQAYILEWG